MYYTKLISDLLNDLIMCKFASDSKMLKTNEQWNFRPKL